MHASLPCRIHSAVRQDGPLCRFYHGYDNYMQHAFPHDELKPLSYSYTDSLGADVLPRCLNRADTQARHGAKAPWALVQASSAMLRGCP
jgi:hypothetical protein